MTQRTSHTKALKNSLPARQDQGDPEKVRERDDVRKLIAQQQLMDIRELLSLPAGRRFFWRMLGEFRMFGISFHADGVGRLDAHLEGKRVCAKWLSDELSHASRENYLLMWTENFGEDL